MSEIVKNEWRWGVVPELHSDAVVMTGGDDKGRPMRPWLVYRYGELIPRACERWYCILSTEPPKMPEPELRLPEGWEVGNNYEAITAKEWMISIIKYDSGNMTDSYSAWRPTRRECVEEINRILEGR